LEIWGCDPIRFNEEENARERPRDRGKQEYACEEGFGWLTRTGASRCPYVVGSPSLNSIGLRPLLRKQAVSIPATQEPLL
jgi:hypothetical protein